MPDKKIIENISNYYPIKISQAFDNNIRSIKSLELIAKSLNDIYRFFEPSLFQGELVVFNNFSDNEIIKDEPTLLYDKNILINLQVDIICIQIMSDGRLLYWQNIDYKGHLNNPETLFYLFHNNREFFYANTNKIEITCYPKGSRFATQFIKLEEVLSNYAIEKIKYSSCPIFETAWFDNNRIFFKGGGKDIPENIMQSSLSNYLKDNIRGIETEILREYTLGASKPVDIRVHWKEANRAVLIELKWLGKSKKVDGNIASTHYNGRANEGMVQLKEYMDLENQDTPTCITKGMLVVIDGRRHNSGVDTVTIKTQDGKYYLNKELIIDEDKQYYESNSHFERPIRMFAEPICI